MGSNPDQDRYSEGFRRFPQAPQAYVQAVSPLGQEVSLKIVSNSLAYSWILYRMKCGQRSKIKQQETGLPLFTECDSTTQIMRERLAERS